MNEPVPPVIRLPEKRKQDCSAVDLACSTPERVKINQFINDNISSSSDINEFRSNFNSHSLLAKPAENILNTLLPELTQNEKSESTPRKLNGFLSQVNSISALPPTNNYDSLFNELLSDDQPNIIPIKRKASSPPVVQPVPKKQRPNHQTKNGLLSEEEKIFVRKIHLAFLGNKNELELGNNLNPQSVTKINKHFKENILEGSTIKILKKQKNNGIYKIQTIKLSPIPENTPQSSSTKNNDTMPSSTVQISDNPSTEVLRNLVSSNKQSFFYQPRNSLTTILPSSTNSMNPTNNSTASPLKLDNFFTSYIELNETTFLDALDPSDSLYP